MSGESMAAKWRMAQGDPERRRALAPAVARAYEDEGNWVEAARFYEHGDDPLSAALIYERELEDLEKAARCFLEAGWVGRAAEVEERLGRADRAVELYDLCQAHEELARLAFESRPAKAGEVFELFHGDFDRAAEAYRRALDQAGPGDVPSAVDLRLRLAHCLARQGRRDEAVAIYREAVTDLRSGGGLADWLSLAAYGIRAGREDLVVEGFETALTIVEADGGSFEVVRLLENYAEAVRAFPNRSLMRQVRAELQREREELDAQGLRVRVPPRDNPSAVVTVDRVPPGMAVIPEGIYWVGDEGDERFPRRKVEVKAFAVDVFPVTNEDYLRFVEATGHRFPRDEKGKGVWRHGRLPVESLHHPVVHVSWEDALAYARWAGKRLLGSSEWEVAASGGDGSRYPWGDRFLPGRCNVVLPGGPRRPGATMPVDAYPLGCSAFGVADCAGNVWEWVFDWFDPGLRLKGIRGGFWASFEAESQLRCAYRCGLDPAARRPNVGLRCAVTVSGPVPASFRAARP